MTHSDQSYKISTAGHSLGGGLAQNIFYHFPSQIEQVYAFDPSPVTGYTDVDDKEIEQKRCDCEQDRFKGESRVFRIYETDEILALFRGPLKLFNPISRHIQEVRFAFDVGHSMSSLATNIVELAGTNSLGQRIEEWKGQRSSDSGMTCTALFTEKFRASCDASNEANYCPN